MTVRFTVNRRRALVMPTIFLTAVALAACGGGGGGNDSPTSDVEQAFADRVVIGTSVSLDSMNALNDQYDTFQYNAFDTLVRFPLGASEPQARLAEAWERIDDNTLQFKLRDATFHDGTPVTAEDVKFSFDTAKSEGYSTALFLLAITEVKVVDSKTIQFITGGPTATLLQSVAQLFVVPKAAWEAAGADAFANKPIGSGPFKVDSFTPGSGATFVAYDGFWGDKPKTPTVELKIFKDNSSLQAALESGQIDAAQDVGFNAMKTLQADDRYVVEASKNPNLSMFHLNTNKAPFDNPKARLAAIKAVDPEALKQAITGGAGVVEDGQVGYEGINGYTSDIKRPEYNLEEAKALVKEAGVEGAEIELLGMAAHKALLEAVGAQLKEAGFNPKVNAADVSVWVQAFRAGTEAHVFYRGLAFVGFNDLDRPFGLVSSSAKPFVQDETWTQMLAASRAELDESARRAKLKEMSQYLLDKSYILYSIAQPNITVKAVGVTGDTSTGLMLDLTTYAKQGG